MGHTHEDIDQLFGILLGLVLRRICFQRPAELRDAIQVAMSPIIASRGEVLGVHLLTHIRDFDVWLKPLSRQGSPQIVSRENMETCVLMMLPNFRFRSMWALQCQAQVSSTHFVLSLVCSRLFSFRS